MILKRKNANKKSGQQRGDTLVEVMLALSILGIVVVGCLSITSRLNSNMLDTIDRSAVRSDMNGQAELLNYVRDNRLGSNVWSDIKSKAVTNPSSIGSACSKSQNSFYLKLDSGVVSLVSGSGINAKNDSGRAVPGNGIIVDAVYVSNTASPSYIDFYINACWSRIGLGSSAQNSTVVRLMDNMR